MQTDITEYFQYVVTQNIKGQLRRKMNLWSNYTLLPSQPLCEICFHDWRM